MDRASSSRSKIVWVCGLILFFTLLFLFTDWPIIADPGSLYVPTYWDDQWTSVAPNQMYLDYALDHGEIPLWNPLIFCGIPFAANPARMVFYPPNILRSIMVGDTNPVNTLLSLAWFVWFHFVVLALGIYLLARRFGISVVGSLAAAIAMVLSARAMENGYGLGTFLAFAAWMPYILLFLRYMAETSRWTERLGWAGRAGLLYGLQVLSGFPQSIIVCSTIYLIYYAAYVLFLRGRGVDRYTSHPSPPRTLHVMHEVSLLALFVGLGACIASVVLLPAMELAALSSRSDTQGLSGMVAIRHGEIMFEAWREAGPRWVHRIRPAARVLSVVISFRVCMLFALIAALFHRNRRVVLLFLGIFYCLVDASLGPPFPFATIIESLSPFDFGPSFYSAIFVGIPGAILIGLGLDACKGLVNAAAGRRKKQMLLMFTGLVLLAVFVRPAGSELPLTSTLIALPVAGLVSLVFAGRFRQRMAWFYVAILLVEACYWNYSFTHDISLTTRPTFEQRARRTPEFWSTNRRTAETALHNLGMFDLEASIGGYDSLQAGWLNEMIRNPGEEVRYDRIILAPDIHLNPRVDTFLKRSFWLTPAFVRGPLPEKTRPFPPTAVTYLPEPGNLPVPEIARSDVPMSSVSENYRELVLWRGAGGATAPQSMGAPVNGRRPIVFSFGLRSLSNTHSALRLKYRSDGPVELNLLLADGKRLPMRRKGPFLLPASEDGEFEWPLQDTEKIRLSVRAYPKHEGGRFEITRAAIMVDEGDQDHHIRIVSRSANQVEVEIGEIQSHQILAFIDSYYSGWKATLDGKETTVFLANDGFKAVVIPPGKHRVKFEFQPDSVYTGYLGSGAGLAIGLTLAAIGKFRRRQETQQEEIQAAS